nr:Gag-Pol polyprotein [Tanacetum cinerariifolium]
MIRKSFPHHPERATNLLGLIHTDVCGLLRHVSRQENQLEKTIKALQSDRGGYPKETMGYYFHFPPKNKTVVARYAEFFKKNLLSQEVSGRAGELEEIQDEDTSPFEIISEIPIEVKVGSESRPPMLNKVNYVPWSSRLLRYAKSRPNGKLIHNSILNGQYVRKMIPEPGDANCDITVTESFHLQTDDELSDKELKQIEANDQAIQTILLGLPEDIYAAVDSCETAQEIWLRVQQMMKGSNIGIQEKNAKLFNEWERFTSDEGESIKSYYHQWSRHVTIVHQTKDLHTADYTQLYDFLKYNQKEKYLQQPMPNPEDITDPTIAMNMALALIAKAFKLNYSTPTNNNQRISSNPGNRQITQPGMNMGQDRQMQMVGGYDGNQFRQYAGQNAGIQLGIMMLLGIRLTRMLFRIQGFRMVEIRMV